MIDIDAMRSAAAVRIFEIITRWQMKNPDCFFVTTVGPTKRYEIVVYTPSGVTTFRGESLQDAYAQMASAVILNEKA